MSEQKWHLQNQTGRNCLHIVKTNFLSFFCLWKYTFLYVKYLDTIKLWLWEIVVLTIIPLSSSYSCFIGITCFIKFSFPLLTNSFSSELLPKTHAFVTAVFACFVKSHVIWNWHHKKTNSLRKLSTSMCKFY